MPRRYWQARSPGGQGALLVFGGEGRGVHQLQAWRHKLAARHPRLTPQRLLHDARVNIALRAGRLPGSSLVARKLGSLGAQTCAAPSYLAERLACAIF